MAREQNWIDVGAAGELATAPLRRVTAAGRALAISFRDGRFGAVANACNHVGGPLGEGRLDEDYIVCPWHNWKFHRCTGEGEPGFEEDRVPSYPVKVEGGRVLVDIAGGTRRTRKPHEPTRWRAKSSVRPDRCGSPASRPRRWMRRIRASPGQTICSATRCGPRMAIRPRRG